MLKLLTIIGLPVVTCGSGRVEELEQAILWLSEGPGGARKAPRRRG